ncbi:acyltransferase family protein [Thalassotalea mangrovi]|uniref:Acyltransferase n=1 Tax=Thalassotalea mangrovi TaxID=2572245 RepID=A0A4U1B6J3_9GAMM|nr:acyltransferase family protein [Thalassotalea mangrovi]TKB46135.1 acyltransferase [Thalassotalea mangrovi]
MEFRHDINGLRAVAVLSVVLFHFGISGFKGGFVGVDIFFVISGYLMTGIIFTKYSKNEFSIFKFYQNRAKRIIPALTVMIGFVLIGCYFILLPSEYELLSEHAIASLGFISNVVYWRKSGYFDTAAHSKWLLHTWSLSVEWQFYILYPIGLTILFRYLSLHIVKMLLLMGLFTSLAFSIWLTYKSANAAFYFLPSRAWQMLFGGLVFLYPLSYRPLLSKYLNYAGLMGIGLSIYLIDGNDAWPGYLALLPTISTGIIILANRQESIYTNNVLSNWMGKISYSVYLWHWPLVVFLSYQGFTSLSWSILGVSLSLLLGYLSWRFIESNARLIDKRSGDVKFLRLNQLGRVCTIALPVLLISFVINYTKGMPERFDKAVFQAEMQANNINPRTSECLISSGINAEDCFYGNDGEINLIVFGDSHANSMVTAIESAMMNHTKGKILFIGYSACSTIPGIKRRDIPYSQCGEFVEEQITRLEKDYSNIPVVIINRPSVSLFNQTNPEKVKLKGPLVYFNKKYSELSGELFNEFENYFFAAMERLSKGRQLYIVKAVPEYSVDIPNSYARELKNGIENSMLTISMDQYRERNQFMHRLYESAAEKFDVTLLDPTDYLCENGFCFAVMQNTPLYYDDNHLSEAGNKLLIPMFESIWGKSNIDLEGNSNGY